MTAKRQDNESFIKGWNLLITPLDRNNSDVPLIEHILPACNTHSPTRIIYGIFFYTITARSLFIHPLFMCSGILWIVALLNFWRYKHGTERALFCVLLKLSGHDD